MPWHASPCREFEARTRPAMRHGQQYGRVHTAARDLERWRFGLSIFAARDRKRSQVESRRLRRSLGAWLRWTNRVSVRRSANQDPAIATARTAAAAIIMLPALRPRGKLGGIRLLQRAEFLVARRALREVVVGGIVDRQFAAGESSQQLRRRTSFARRIRMRAPEEQVHFVFNSETRRVRALTAVRHRLSRCRCSSRGTRSSDDAGNDL